MSIRIAIITLVVGGILGAPAYAQSGASVRVTASAEPMTAAVGETITFTVRVEGVPSTVIRTPDQPAVVNLSPERRAPRTQRLWSTRGDANGKGATFTWQFRPTAAGMARIRPVTVVVRGETYTTAPIQIQVTSSSPNVSDPTLTRPSDAAGTTPLDANDLFIRATATADRAYQNEQVVVEYRLFYRPGIRLRHSRLADSWDAPGFWREELDVATRPTPQTRRVDGQRYETVVLKRVALFPTRPGTLRVDPLRIETEAQGTLRMRRGGPAVRGRFRPVRLASRDLSVQVRPLPPSAPPSFDGAVGQFSMTARVDSATVAVGAPVSLTVRIRGAGNLTTLSPPRLDVPADIEVYEPTVATDVERNGRRIRGSRTFVYTLVPQTGGRHVLPPITFSHFAPEAGRYNTLRARVAPLKVTGEAAPRAVGRTGDGLPVGDITAVMAADEADWVRTDRRPLYRHLWAYLALLVPVIGMGGALLYRQWGQSARTTSQDDPDAGSDTAQDRLQEARRRLADGDEAAVYDAVEQSFWTFFDGRLDGEDVPPTRTALDQRLARHGVPEPVRNRLYALLDRCDAAQFAPGAKISLEEILDEADMVLDQLDEHLPASARSADV